MNEVTQMLNALSAGTARAEELLPLVYQDLRRLAAVRMAGEAPGHTLQATALVHEAWLRVAGENHSWNDRQHFFRVAAEAMRRILIDNARRKRRQKRGAHAEHVSLDDVDIAAADSDEQLLQIHEVLDELAAESSTLAELIKLRFFVGLRMSEIAEVMGISPTTAKRHFTYARAWLFARLKSGG